MTAASRDEWVIHVWNYFRPRLESGRPFYLALDTNSLIEIGRDFLPTFSRDECINDFRESCQTLLNVNQSTASIKNECFQKIEGHEFSRTILLAAQQVLVVESMLTQHGISADSYFPRYRAELGLALGPRHSNPLAKDFEKIWWTLRDEILAITANCPNVITFRKGQGANLNRHLPMSQALFTKRDLDDIDAISANEGRSNSIKSFQELLSFKNKLRKRASILISKATTNEQLRDSLIQQIKSYQRTNRLERTAAEFIKKQSLESWLVAYLDFEQILQYSFNIYERFTSEQLTDTTPAVSLLEKGLSEDGYIALQTNEDHFKQVDKRNPFVQSNAVLFITSNSGSANFLHLLKERHPTVQPLSLASNLPQGFRTFLCGNLNNSPLLSKFDPLEEQADVGTLKLTGGLLVEPRNHSYLIGYPPIAIMSGDELLPEDTQARVNDSNISLGEFFQSLPLSQAADFILELHDKKLFFSLSSRKHLMARPERIGFQFTDKELSSFSSKQFEESNYLLGTIFVRRENEISQPNKIELLPSHIFSNSRRIPLPTATIKKIVETLLDKCNDPATLFAIKTMQLTNTIPLSLYRNIRQEF